MQRSPKKKKRRDKRSELCIERRPRRHVFSTICSKEDRMPTNKETLQSAVLSHCGKTLPYTRKKKTFTWVLFNGDERNIAIRMRLLIRNWINSALSTVNKNQELQRGDCTKHVHKSAGSSSKIRILLSKKKGRFISCNFTGNYGRKENRHN